METNSGSGFDGSCGCLAAYGRNGYDWKRETGEIQSYQHNQTRGWLHIDPQGQFYDRHAQPLLRAVALEQSGTVPASDLSRDWGIAR